MFGLWMFGSPLEQLWGRQKFLFYYFSAGLGAAAVLQMIALRFSVSFSNRCFKCIWSNITTEIIDTIAVGRFKPKNG